MQITKEKLLALVALLVALVVVANLHLPQVEAVPEVPAEEQARSYRTISSTPRLAPERSFESQRDPFRPRDPWAEAAPALLAVPPATSWPRALPGGPAAAPSGPQDRLLVTAPPKKKGAQ